MHSDTTPTGKEIIEHLRPMLAALDAFIEDIVLKRPQVDIQDSGLEAKRQIHLLIDPPREICKHEYLDTDGACKTCGEDCRGSIR